MLVADTMPASRQASILEAEREGIMVIGKQEALRKPRRMILAAAVVGIAAAGVGPAAAQDTATVHAMRTDSAGVACRSDSAAPYWYGGVESDACAGPDDSGVFSAQAVVNMDPDGTILDTAGPVQACQVQLQSVAAGVATPLAGYTATESGQDPSLFDGHYCEADGQWDLPPGWYNAVTSYESGDVWSTTVQSPVVWFAGS